MSLRNERLDQILTQARPKISRHWSLYDGGLGHGGTAVAVARVDERLAGYFEKLKDLPDQAPATAILHEVKMLLQDLAVVNASCGRAFLETEERDLLVPIIIEAATAVGLDPNEFEDGDPTLQFRAEFLVL